MKHTRWLQLVIVVVSLVIIYRALTVVEKPPPGQGRMESTDCWFEAGVGWPVHECYYFHVPENHDSPNGRTVAFPLLVFRSATPVDGLAPVLHLGGGGPGSPVYLDYPEGANSLWVNHDDMSLKQGRDLYVMDPRGTGLSRPLLTCQTYVDNVLPRWQKDLSLVEEWHAGDADYAHCFDELRDEADFSAYNSLAIARDVEWLRNTIGVQQWVLIGVSYGSVYAQNIVREYHDRVESMILDSAAFPNLHADHDYYADTMAPYLALFDYCNADPRCDVPMEHLPVRLWQLVEALDKDPLTASITHPYDGDSVEVVLNGHRLVEVLLWGTYGEEVFRVLPTLIMDLEQRVSVSLTPFIESYLGYLLDPTFGDVSAGGHYCYETKPFMDFDNMRVVAHELPSGYIRDSALLAIDWPDQCAALAVEPGEPRLGMALETDVPTLFLHGALDPITRLDDVQRQLAQFSNGVIISFPLSHDVLSSTQCAETIAAKFVRNPFLEDAELTCPPIKPVAN